MLENANLRERGQAFKDKARRRFTDPKSWKLPKQESSIAPPNVWSNSDMDPVPPERQAWGKSAFVTYWFSDLVTISTWSTGSAIVTTVLNGAIGADLHIPFPIASRASFGYWLSYFAVISRGILAMFWFGVQTANGGTCVTAVGSLKSSENMPVTFVPDYPSRSSPPSGLVSEISRTICLPASAGLTTVGMVSYFIYWLLQFPMLLIPTHKLQYMFWVKTVLTPPMAVAMVIWIAVRAGGQGEFFNQPSQVHGAERAWLWISNLTSVIRGYSTLAVNIADFSRFSKRRSSQLWQLPVIPFFKTIVALFGVISASAAQQIWGVAYWTPPEILQTWQNTPGGRAAAFFCASIWLLAQISVNISANAVSFANDITTVAPMWFNIRRGTIFVALIGGWALCPWIVVASGQAFLNLMSAYAIFMGPAAGILFTDYWLVKHRKYDVPALYDPHGIYSYGKYGTHWRAAAATALVIIPMLPRLVAKVAPKTVHIDKGLANLFSFNWLYGFFLSIFIYYLSNLFFPHKTTLIPHVVTGFSDVVEGLETGSEGQRAEGSEKLEKEMGLATRDLQASVC